MLNIKFKDLVEFAEFLGCDIVKMPKENFGGRGRACFKPRLNRIELNQEIFKPENEGGYPVEMQRRIISHEIGHFLQEYFVEQNNIINIVDLEKLYKLHNPGNIDSFKKIINKLEREGYNIAKLFEMNQDISKGDIIRKYGQNILEYIRMLEVIAAKFPNSLADFKEYLSGYKPGNLDYAVSECFADMTSYCVEPPVSFPPVKNEISYINDETFINKPENFYQNILVKICNWVKENEPNDYPEICDKVLEQDEEDKYFSNCLNKCLT